MIICYHLIIGGVLIIYHIILESYFSCGTVSGMRQLSVLNVRRIFRNNTFLHHYKTSSYLQCF